MEVHFSPEQEAQISQIASYNGTPAEQLVKQAALRLVEEEAEVRAGIRLGIEQADVGELIDHEDVKSRLYRRLQARTSGGLRMPPPAWKESATTFPKIIPRPL